MTEYPAFSSNRAATVSRDISLKVSKVEECEYSESGESGQSQDFILQACIALNLPVSAGPEESW